MTSSLCDILPAAAATLGVPEGHDVLGLRERVGTRNRVVVILVDGMGLHLLPAMAPHAPLLASVLAGSVGQLDELSCTFPSTTPTSLVSLTTGVSPGEHGILGFTVRVPGTDRVLTHILWRDDPVPELWQPVPTWFERCSAAGIDSRVVLPAMFDNSGLTRAAYRGARFRGVDHGPRIAATIADEVGAGPGLIYGYTSVLDTAAHVHGIASSQWARAAQHVDRMLSEVLDALPTDAVLLVTADHGGLDVAAEGRFDADSDPAMIAGVATIAGEPRVRYVHTLDGAREDVIDAWRAVLADAADVIDRDEAIESGLFGPTNPAHRERIGDVVVICRGDAVVLATAHEPAEVAALVGFHGALTPAETAIPLITFAG